jgi:hypothetical protein
MNENIEFKDLDPLLQTAFIAISQITLIFRKNNLSKEYLEEMFSTVWETFDLNGNDKMEKILDAQMIFDIGMLMKDLNY